MQEHQKISELKVGERVDSVYVIRNATRESAKNGNEYWRLQLSDATGTVTAMQWGPRDGGRGEEQEDWKRVCNELSERPSPAWAHVQGTAGDFRGLQISVRRLTVLSPEESAAMDMADYVASSPLSGREMLREADTLCEEELAGTPWKDLVSSVLGEAAIRKKISVAPAAKAMHHARAGGLLEHSLSVARLCLKAAGHYKMDKHLLLAAALLHDIGKLEEMNGDPLSTEYTLNGNLLGHLFQGLIMLEPFLERTGISAKDKDLFRHLIASHHGSVEFGTVWMPGSPEAHALHFADDLDAKMDHCREMLAAESPQMHLCAFKGELLCQPARTPGGGSCAGLAEAESLTDAFTYGPWKIFVEKALRELDPMGEMYRSSSSVARMCLIAAEHYQGVGMDWQSILAAALLRNVGSLQKKGRPAAGDHRIDVKQLGHLARGLLLLEPFLKESGLAPGLCDHFRHLLASHHGEKWKNGAGRKPLTPEAFVLWFVNDLDMKIAGMKDAMSAEEGDPEGLQKDSPEERTDEHPEEADFPEMLQGSLFSL